MHDIFFCPWKWQKFPIKCSIFAQERFSGEYLILKKKMCSHSLSCSAAGLNVRPVINLAKYSIVCVRVKKDEGGVGVVYLCVFT